MDLLNSCRGLLSPLVLAVSLGGMGAAALPAPAANEYEVKAAVLYNLGKFVDWPSEWTNGPLCIGIVGQDPFGQALDEVARGKPINGREVVIKRFKPGEDFIGCHIVFIGSSEKSRLRSILSRFGTRPVLTVGDMPGFCDEGGIVSLELVDNKVRLTINRDVAEKARLHLSSKLLSLARSVRNGGQWTLR